MTRGTDGTGSDRTRRPDGGGPGTNAGAAGGTGPGRVGTAGNHGGTGNDPGHRKGKGPKS